MHPSALPFRKSSYSSTHRDCVEVADLPGMSAVRDTKHPEEGHLSFGAPEWRVFVDSVKAARG
ncbi:DUF397 domain-containing protein [Nocardiopsis flavescens]|uniref:DUF397 domain-containing protein n=1 Tax=Nocardiopsis flavescens TaxID=758803 RepID=UPI003654AB29